MIIQLSGIFIVASGIHLDLWSPQFRHFPPFISCQSFQIRGGEVPVDQMVEERLRIVGAAVLEIQVIGVFPDVTGDQGNLAADDGGVGVGGLDNLEGAAVDHQPRPTAAELGDGGVLELLLEFVKGAEGGVNAGGDAT